MSLRFITISSLLLLAIASTLFTGFHCKGAKNIGFVVSASDEEVHPKNVYVVAAAATARSEKTLSSRKMVIDNTIIHNPKAGNSLMARGNPRSFRRITLNKTVNVVAFTADYHQPRHHPPKNN